MQNIGFVIFPAFQVMSFGVITAFEMANSVLSQPAYKITLLSETGGLVASSAGFRVETQAFGNAEFDLVIIGAGTELQPASPALIDFVQQAATTAKRIAAPCTGAFVLAEAGMLDGKRATTHWFFAHDLQKRFPKVKVEEDRIYITDGTIWTSAGMTAGIDLAMAMIEQDYGTEVARSVARKMVVYHRRSGGQSQFSALLELEPKSDRIQQALSHARSHLKNNLSVEELADAAHLSPRQFSRAFRSETGQSPAKAVEQMRVEVARLMIEEGRHSLELIADETGFADRERMRRAFLRILGQPPQALRRFARI